MLSYLLIIPSVSRASSKPLHQNAYKHPYPGSLGRIVEGMANSDALARSRRAVMSRLPYPTLQSDVTDVVYLTWLVDVRAVEAFVPKGVQLWQRDGLTPFTTLTYCHGHFGPAACPRAVRKLLASPLQSNWRLYLRSEADDGEAPSRVVLFVKNIISNGLYALGARMLSDVLPTHLSHRFIHTCDGNAFRTEIAGGAGSAPSLSSTARLAAERELPPSFATMFDSWLMAVEFLTCQEAAIAPLPSVDDLALAKIEIPIALPDVLPLHVAKRSVLCPFVESLSLADGRDEPFCFAVPRVLFRVTSERILSRRDHTVF